MHRVSQPSSDRREGFPSDVFRPGLGGDLLSPSILESPFKARRVCFMQAYVMCIICPRFCCVIFLPCKSCKIFWGLCMKSRPKLCQDFGLGVFSNN